MAYTTINKSTTYHNANTYTGNATARSFTGLGHQPDMVFLRARDASANTFMFDSVRGATKNINWANSNGESTNSDYVTSFDSDGYSIGAANSVNYNGDEWVGWTWKTGTTGSGNTTGSGSYKTYSYSVNTTAGTSIVKYTGNGTAGHTIPHHLGQAPTWTIVKALGNSEAWQIICAGLDADKFIQNNNDSQLSQGSYNMFNSTRPSSTVVTLGNQNHTNQNNIEYIMYNFCNVSGFSKSGSYSGNGSTDGTFVYTGFKPKFLMIKRADTGNSYDDWHVFDYLRQGYNPNNRKSEINDIGSESTDDTLIDLVSNGFKWRTTNSNDNGNGSLHIYLAFGQSLVGSNNIPCTAR